MTRPARVLLSHEEFVALAGRVRSIADSVPETTESIRDIALRCVRSGRVIGVGEGPSQPGMGKSVSGAPGAGPTPYRLTQWVEGGEDWSAVNDRLELDIHGSASMTHLDTTEHFAWPSPGDTSTVLPSGDPLSEYRNGLTGRGILLDIPGATGGPVPPGAVVTLDDLDRACRRQGVEPSPGDALYLAFGRDSPRRSDVALGQEELPGLSIECAEWLAGRRPSVVLTDLGLDGVPSEVTGIPTPWHILLLSVLGIPLVDMANLGELRTACAGAGRWDFLSVIAPLYIPRASGSPVNPLAIL